MLRRSNNPFSFSSTVHCPLSIVTVFPNLAYSAGARVRSLQRRRKHTDHLPLRVEPQSHRVRIAQRRMSQPIKNNILHSLFSVTCTRSRLRSTCPGSKVRRPGEKPLTISSEQTHNFLKISNPFLAIFDNGRDVRSKNNSKDELQIDEAFQQYIRDVTFVFDPFSARGFRFAPCH